MGARRLVLLRHAKADPPGTVADEDRPLSGRGRADARAAGQWLAAHQRPELVLCSPVKRTRQTWHAVLAELGDAKPEVRYERLIYTGDAAALLALVHELPDPVGTALLIGHNPVLTQLALGLDPDGGLDSDGLHTCGLAVHEVAGGWAACQPGQARLSATYTARAG